ncbi:aldehyde dehydrogenase [Thraustotheca clavata]|uniref:Aldehyde dehydrogenase n=1 Tax=Thraustotheca clavata TaxID=74557 RepID=A0A1V9YYU2_9STRA|nr:aldehyde dehydrogenase [Thraustotheca clavata]
MQPSYVLTLNNLINGALEAPTEREFAEAISFPCTKDAATGEDLSLLLATDSKTIERALEVSMKLHTSRTWTELLKSPERENIFEKLAVELETRQEDIRVAEMIDVGDREAISGYGPHLLRNPELLRNPREKDEVPFVDQWTSLTKEGVEYSKIKAAPIGPVVIIAPTNAPLGSSLIQIISALFYGCPVIIKPSPYSPHSFNVFAEAILAADLPPALVQIVHGGAEVANQLIASPLSKGVCFTGSTAVGLQISAQCAPQLKPFVLELGGINPFFVFADADINAAVQGLLKTFSCINGQYCCGATNVLVHSSIREEFISTFLNQSAKISIGDPRDESNSMGALNMAIASTLRKNVEHLLSYPEAKKIAAYVKTPEEGFYEVPALIEDIPTSVQAELFGPIALLRTFQTTDEAIALANLASAHLKTYVYGNPIDVDRVVNEVECGWFDVNQSEFENQASFDLSYMSGFGHADSCFFTRRILRN